MICKDILIDIFNSPLIKIYCKYQCFRKWLWIVDLLQRAMIWWQAVHILDMELQKQDGTLREDTLERKESNRRCASELKAIYSGLPFWYRLLLKKRKESPVEASKDLIGLSNSSSWEDGLEYEKGVRKNLGIPPKNAEI